MVENDNIKIGSPLYLGNGNEQYVQMNLDENGKPCFFVEIDGISYQSESLERLHRLLIENNVLYR